MRAYSNDLRECIRAAVERGDYPLHQLAHLFSVSLSFLVRLLQRKRCTGSVQPKPHAGGPTPKLDAAAQARLLALVHDQPDATLAELRDRLGVDCSLMTIARALKRHGISRKKKTVHADERDRPDIQAQRAAFDQRLSTVDPTHLVFVDEMGANTAMTRTYGRAPIGERVEATAPGQWQNVTLIVGLRAAGVVAPLAFEGPTDQVALRTYVQDVLVPELHAGDVVVWDNLKPHKDAEAIATIEAAGASVEPLPP
jgi:transposase